MTAGLLKRSDEDGRSQTSATEIRIRDAAEADLPAIVEIHNEAIASRISSAQLDPVTVEGRREWFRVHSPMQYPIWVADLDGAIAGWLSFREFLPRCAYRDTVELSVYVSEQFRRRGVGRKLLQEAIARGPQLGMHSLVGLIFGHNEPSIALFRLAGFERWGLLPGVARVDEIPRDLTIFGRHI
ncbi:MAG: N-acetyltransferase [Verrucomicrobia bacterium]|nr:MAG: N-acetyltransferase [Verrucomicrobiota bacterium]